MKVCCCPVDFKEPKFKLGIDDVNAIYEKAIAEHKKQLIDRLHELGYTGKNTGLIYSEAVADGSAEYMFAQTKTGKSFLIHLPYFDGYRSLAVQHMTKKAVLESIEMQNRLKALMRR